VSNIRYNFSGKTALVTGGGTGIGKATALAFARAGASVVIGNRNAEKGEATVSEITAAGGQATFRRTDVSQEADVQALVQTAVDTYGGLDIAFNNAGYFAPAAPTAEAAVAEFDQVVAVNIRGVFLCMKYEIPEILKRGGGAIINVSSALGEVAMPGAGAYNASKHAVLGLTKTAALEYGAQGIRINALLPALTETDMAHDGMLAGDTEEARKQAYDYALSLHPVGRLGTVDDMAAAALYLASEEAGFVLGHSLAVDGGWLAR